MMQVNTGNSKIDILGVDMGTYNTKTSRNFVCRSIFSEDTKYNISSKGLIDIKGKRYHIGVGKINTEIIKSKRPNLPLFLYAISKSTNSNIVKAVVGLPKYQLDNDEYVEQIRNRFIGSFEFTCDGVKRMIEVLDISIYPEGVGAYYTITKDLNDKEVILIDIGGTTINVLWFSNGCLVKVKTLPFGSLNLLTDVSERIMTIHGGRCNIEMASKHIQRGKVGKTDDTLPYLTELGKQYIDDLLTLLDLEFPVESAEYFLSGGGVEVFADCIISSLGDIGLICDYLYANANGFEIIGEAIFNG